MTDETELTPEPLDDEAARYGDSWLREAEADAVLYPTYYGARTWARRCAAALREVRRLREQCVTDEATWEAMLREIERLKAVAAERARTPDKRTLTERSADAERARVNRLAELVDAERPERTPPTAEERAEWRAFTGREMALGVDCHESKLHRRIVRLLDAYEDAERALSELTHFEEDASRRERERARTPAPTPEPSADASECKRLADALAEAAASGTNAQEQEFRATLHAAIDRMAAERDES